MAEGEKEGGRSRVGACIGVEEKSGKRGSQNWVPRTRVGGVCLGRVRLRLGAGHFFVGAPTEVAGAPRYKLKARAKG